jgi:hypothetical protein
MFGGASGSTTATDWRAFASLYAPFVYIEIWTVNAHKPAGSLNALLTEEELALLLLLSEIIDITLRSVISETQVEVLSNRISRIQALGYRLHPGLSAVPNLHFLSHLPQDIRSHGPVYSWWLFPLERLNKLLKSTKRNGHAQDIALQAFRKFERFTTVGSIGGKESQGAKTAGELFAQQLRQNFFHAGTQSNKTEVQEEAEIWERDLQERTDALTESGTGDLVFLSPGLPTPIGTQLLRDIQAAWNSTDGSKVSLPDEVTLSHDVDTIVLPNNCGTFSRVGFGRRHFRTTSSIAPITHRLNLDPVTLEFQIGAFIDYRADTAVLGCVYFRCPLGLIESVMRFTAISVDGKSEEERTFLKVRWFREFRGQDPYRFSQRM